MSHCGSLWATMSDFESLFVCWTIQQTCQGLVSIHPGGCYVRVFSQSALSRKCPLCRMDRDLELCADCLKKKHRKFHKPCTIDVKPNSVMTRQISIPGILKCSRAQHSATKFRGRIYLDLTCEWMWHWLQCLMRCDPFWLYKGRSFCSTVDSVDPTSISQVAAPATVACHGGQTLGSTCQSITDGTCM